MDILHSCKFFLGNKELSEDDEREECPDGSSCEKRRNGRHRGKYKHIKITRPEEKKSSGKYNCCNRLPRSN